MNLKRKGIQAERELIKLFWENGWGCIRSAGSGSTQYPSPDILAGNKLRKIAIESKVSSSSSKYFEKKEIKQLQNFCDYFGAESWLAIKFQNKNWFFLTVEDLKETNKGFSITEINCDIKGLTPEEFFLI